MKQKEQIIFIINPSAGRQRRNKNLEEVILSEVDPKKWSPEIIFTEYPGHAREIVSAGKENGVKYAVAVGGDGTVNEVASACLKNNIKLGIIPCGSGNGLARELKIPLNSREAVRCINKGQSRVIDAGSINGAHFFCTCGTGFDALIGHKFAKQKKRGFSTYVKTAIKEFFGYSPKKYTVKIEGDKIKRHAFLITAANAGQYGNNAYIAPGAEIDDGLLDICLLEPFPWHKAVSLGARLFTSTIDKSRYLEIIRSKKVVLTQKKKFKFHIDGDPYKFKGPVKIEIVPAALNVIVNPD